MNWLSSTRNLILLTGLSFVLITTVKAQGSAETDSQRLTKQAYEVLKATRYSEAVALAEKVVELERSAKPLNSQNLATAITNLALLKREHYWVLRRDLATPTISREDLRQTGELIVSYAKSIAELLREAINLYEQDVKQGTPEQAQIQFELATVYERIYSPFFKDVEKTSAVGRLYTESLAIRRRLLGNRDDQTLQSILSLADHLLSRAELERAIPLYREYLESAAAKTGTSSQLLLSPLRSLGRIYVATGQPAEVESIQQQVSLITGKREELGEPEIDLSFRSREDYAQKIIDNPKFVREGMKRQKWLLVKIRIDENGDVTDANASDPKERDMLGKDVQGTANKEIKKWRFRPFVFGSTARKLNGIAWFPYLIAIK